MYESRITAHKDLGFYALIVRVDKDGEESVIHGYKGRYLKTLKSAEASISRYLKKARLAQA